MAATFRLNRQELKKSIEISRLKALKTVHPVEHHGSHVKSSTVIDIHFGIKLLLCYESPVYCLSAYYLR